MPIFDNWNEGTTVKEVIGQAKGASAIVDELTGFVINCIDRVILEGSEGMDQDVEGPVNPQEPYLGLATTEELFRELITRFTFGLDTKRIGTLILVERALTLAEMLGSLDASEREYRTVDSY